MPFVEYRTGYADIYGEHGNLVFNNSDIAVSYNGLYVEAHGRTYSRDEISEVEHDESNNRVLVTTSSGVIDIRGDSTGLHDALTALQFMQ